jgi:hypothetical protein
MGKIRYSDRAARVPVALTGEKAVFGKALCGVLRLRGVVRRT